MAQRHCVPEQGAEPGGKPRRPRRGNPLAYLLEEQEFVGTLDEVQAVDEAELASPASLAWLAGLTTETLLPRAPTQAGPTPPAPAPCPSAMPGNATAGPRDALTCDTRAAAGSGIVSTSLPDMSCSGGDRASTGGGVVPAPRARRTRVSTRTPEERLQATREKNRRAQKNFRDRQKDKATQLEQQVAELQQQAAALEDANKKLEAATAVRFKVAGLRGEQIERLQSEWQVFGELSSETVVHEGSLRVAAGAPCDASPATVLRLQQHATADGVQSYETVRAKLEHGMHRKTTLCEELQGGGAAATLVVDINNAVIGSEAQQQQQQQLATVATHRVGLQQAIMQEAQGVARLCGLTAVFAPGNFKRLFAEHPSTSGGDAAEVRFWEERLAGLQLSEAQEMELVRLTSKHIAKQQVLLEQRRLLAVQLCDAVAASAPDRLAYMGSGANPDGRERDLVASTARCHELVQAMHAHLRKEHCTWLDFSTMAYAHVLAPWQAAKLGNGADFPDLTALGTAVARRRGAAWTSAQVKEDGTPHRAQGLVTSM